MPIDLMPIHLGLHIALGLLLVLSGPRMTADTCPQCDLARGDLAREDTDLAREDAERGSTLPTLATTLCDNAYI